MSDAQAIILEVESDEERHMLESVLALRNRCIAAEARVKVLEEWNGCEVSFRQADNAVWAGRLERVTAQLDAANAVIAGLREALAWYADRGHWTDEGVAHGRETLEGITFSRNDCGRRARTALAGKPEPQEDGK